ncbi:MAG: sigma-70 family RNA polymerase sigma factor [Planctomycetota bacterium]
MKSNVELNPDRWDERYGKDLYRFGLSKLRDPDTAEDLVQETFLAAWKGRESFSGRSSEKTWLIGILKHKIVDTLRKRIRDRRVGRLDAGDEDREALPEGMAWEKSPTWGGDPAETAERRELWDVLSRSLEKLPPRHTQAFVLKDVKQEKSEEVRKSLDVSSGNLNVILHRARGRLRVSLERHGFRECRKSTRCG